MSHGFRLFVAGTSIAAAFVLWASLVQAQQLPQQFPTPEARQSQLRDRLSGAAAQVQDACRDELRNFCSTVTPGEGRVLLCMQAHENKISRQCELALFDASRYIQQATRRVERIAEACWGDIQANCSGSGSIGQCIVDRRASFSQPCQAVIAETLQQQAARQPPPVVPQRNLIGLPIYSTDGAKLGEITAVDMTSDGKLRGIKAEMSHVLGLGTNSVLISPDDLRVRDNHVELPLRADDIRTILMQQR